MRVRSTRSMSTPAHGHHSLRLLNKARYHHLPKQEFEEKRAWRNVEEVISFIDKTPTLTTPLEKQFLVTQYEHEQNSARWALRNSVKNGAHYSSSDKEKQNEVFLALVWLIAFVEEEMPDLRTRVAESAKTSCLPWQLHTRLSDRVYRDFESHYEKWLSESHRLQIFSEEAEILHSEEERVIVYLALVMFGLHNKPTSSQVKEKIKHKGI
ncbi:hypothetical protein DFH28DRAFT_1119318 [Melampsora americana]|nr:hypothetical protein DFH28DRAFT_1119318 [Melampsora americana]